MRHTARKNEHYLSGATNNSLLDIIKPTIYKLTEKHHVTGLLKVRYCQVSILVIQQIDMPWFIERWNRNKKRLNPTSW